MNGNGMRGWVNEKLILAEQMIAAHPDSPLGHDIKASLEASMRRND